MLKTNNTIAHDTLIHYNLIYILYTFVHIVYNIHIHFNLIIDLIAHLEKRIHTYTCYVRGALTIYIMSIVT